MFALHLIGCTLQASCNMYAVSLAVSKVIRASGRLFQRRNRSNDDENSPFVQVTDAATKHTDECDESEPKNMPLTYSCCMRWAWPAVTFRSKSHPHEVHVSVRDQKGDTALHWACFGSPPVEAVEALLTACPELASAANQEGQLPLHGESLIFSL
jgi:ankyrin repeat protein